MLKETFQGIYEDEDEQYRVEAQGCGVYHIYEREGNAYVMSAAVSADNADEALEKYHEID